MTPHYRLIERLSPVALRVPGHSKKGLVLSFDVETFPSTGVNRHEADEEYEEFIPRLIELLDSYQVKAQFFVCGRVMELYSDELDALVRNGHGLGGHGYMHERMSALSFTKQKKIIAKVRAAAREFLRTELRSWRSPYLISNFGTYKALRENGFKVSSSTMEARRPVFIKGIIEVPLIAMDGDVLGYSSSDPEAAAWIDFMKESLSQFDSGIFVFGMHTWLQAKHDPRLSGMARFLSWIQASGQAIWVGNLDKFSTTNRAPKLQNLA